MVAIQPTLFPFLDTTRSINVASIPKRSLFRYPGGKTWLVPYIRSWLTVGISKPSQFIELFAGGGIVGLTVAAEDLADHILLVELDAEVAAVWQVSLGAKSDWLAKRIIEFDMTESNVDTALSQVPQSLEDRAFQTILRNRVNHGGILAAGVGRIKDGENGKGLKSRWYPLTLKKRIYEIQQLTNMSFIHGDAFEILPQYQQKCDVAFFIDPPYTASYKKAGTRLYQHSQIDHEQLFWQASQIAGNFLMTYDNDIAVHTLARRYGFDYELVAMKNTRHASMSELLISKNLEWLRQTW